jgi:hypothetical protein
MRRVTKAYAESIPRAAVPAFLHEPGTRAVVLPTALWQQIADQGDPFWLTCEAQGWNTAKGWDWAKGTPALVDLTLVVKR